MKVLITGHMGFVGRHYMKYIKNKYPNSTVVGVDIKEGNDCRDYFKVSTDIFDLVIHLAAIVGGRETIENEPLSVATDLSIDSEFFNWVIKTKQSNVIYFSSSAAYPVHLQLPELSHRLKESDIDLKDIRLPDYTYGWAKLTGEYLANFVRQSGTNVYVFRPFSGYGEDQDLSYPFPSFIDRYKRRVETFEIWGDGNQVRDFIHIDDIIEATMYVYENKIQTDALNLGSGIPTSFNQLSEKIFNITNWKPKNGVLHLTDKPTGVQFRVCDPSNMLSIYKPKYSFEERLEIILKKY